MLDRPIPFDERLRRTWPVLESADPAIERALQRLSGSEPRRRDAPDAPFAVSAPPLLEAGATPSHPVTRREQASREPRASDR